MKPTEQDYAWARKWCRDKWGGTFDGYPVEVEAAAQGRAQMRADVSEWLRTRGWGTGRGFADELYSKVGV